MKVLTAAIFLIVISSTAAISNRPSRQLDFANNGFYNWYQQLQQQQPDVYTEENREYYQQYYSSYYGNSYQSVQQTNSAEQAQQSVGDPSADQLYQTYFQGERFTKK